MLIPGTIMLSDDNVIGRCHGSVSFRLLHTTCCPFRVHVFARPATMAGCSNVDGPSSSRQQRTWDIIWSSPHFVDCVSSKQVIFARPNQVRRWLSDGQHSRSWPDPAGRNHILTYVGVAISSRHLFHIFSPVLCGGELSRFVGV